MKLIFVFSLLLSSQVFANSFVNLECKPVSPCQYANRGLRYCVSLISVSGRPNGFGEEVINFVSPDVRREVKLVPQKSPISIKVSGKSFKFQNSDGDQWGELVNQGTSYRGYITVDEDFQFQVVCGNRAFGFE